ncbi:MAG: PLDc N-terminal domain-containing protein [Verrucomicrobia bacterium]|nr:PLDc N-terminal domain-containing protein [Verrucomicrobiota bacterium]
MLGYVPQRRTPAAARTWLLLIFFFPWGGLLLYLVLGRLHLPKRRREMLGELSDRVREAAAHLPPGIRAPLQSLPFEAADAARLAENLTSFPMLAGNQVELLDDYIGSLERLAADMDAATGRIHLLYYIYGDDDVAAVITRALERAVRRGVVCRVLLDGVGSKRALRGLGPRWRGMGIEVVELLPVRFFHHREARADIRNHRKIAVLDGRVGYVGSQNLVAPHFVPGHPNEELVARVTGPIVSALEAVFLSDRAQEGSGDIGALPEIEPQPPTGAAFAQLIPSSPGYRQQTFATLLVSLIHQARTRVHITTPYFVPDEPFLAAIRTAVQRGVDVRVVLSLHSNQLFTILAQRSFYDELLDAGVTVHLYRPRFLHAKSVRIDEALSIVGSSNIDIRSFALNAESSLMVWDPGVAAQLDRINRRHFEDSEVLDPAAWATRPFTARAAQNIARLADSPL